ncbi:MAG TPA: flagellar motor protein MotB [Vicinamibacterales bacterium]|nr:flagellar motor protein MotB [Vicinamibacterales bacterium]
MAATGSVVVVRNRRRRHRHAHHGGAWKVAYADFVTAMMAFFMVMWLVGQNAAVKKAIADYFRDPGAFEHAMSDGVLPGSVEGLTGGPAAGAPVLGGPGTADDRKSLTEAADRIRRQLVTLSGVSALKDQIEFVMTPEGLRIELVDRSGSSFFDSGSAVLRGESIAILTVIATELDTLRNDIVIEGHTDSRQYVAMAAYNNWDLSSDRANAARRVILANGLQHGQLKAVRGFADTQLRFPDEPLDPRNRRVSIIISTKDAKK